MLSVVVLAPANVVHTQRWVEALDARGVRIVLATQHEPRGWTPPAAVRLVRLPHAGGLGYFRNVGALRRLLREVRPDLLHAHYASGYGTTAALARFHPWLLSAWGSDVYDFPFEGALQGWWLRRNLRAADALASTSEAMAAQMRRLIGAARPIAVTPFGVDVDRFAPAPTAHDGFVVGTVKTLAAKYGIDTLLRGFAGHVAAREGGAARPARAAASGEPAGRGTPDERRARLVVVGAGEERARLEALAAELGIAAQTTFAGFVGHAEVPRWLHGFDVYVAASRLDSESFGVAVVEAQACALPVVVSDAGGLPEVVDDGVTGLVVPRDDAAAIAAAIGRLRDDPALRARLGAAGRRRVVERYEWQRCVTTMLDLYERVARRGGATVEPSALQDAGPARAAAVKPGPPLGVRAPVGDDAADRRAPAGAPAPSNDESSDGRPAASAPERRISIVVPCRNELDHLDAFLASACAQRLATGLTLEIVVADGQSDDGTRQRLQAAARVDPRLVVVDNPRRIVSCGLNRALAVARGNVVVRMDVHTEYADDYVQRCVEALESTGADNVGGAWRAEAAAGAGPMQRAVAAAFQSPWVAGGAASRRLDFEGEVDTVYLGAWPRATFARFGGFDETLVRNQDDEHNLRIVLGGGRIVQSPRIVSRYRPRARLRQVARQYAQYGYWKPFVMRKHGQPARLRHLVPASFVVAVAAATLAWPLGAGPWPLAALLGAYALVVAALTMAIAAPRGTPGPAATGATGDALRSQATGTTAGPGRPGLDAAALLRVPAVIATYHVAYGLGSIAGWYDAVVRGGAGRGVFTTLSR